VYLHVKALPFCNAKALPQGQVLLKKFSSTWKTGFTASFYHSPNAIQSREKMYLGKKMFVQSTAMSQSCQGIINTGNFCWKELTPTVFSTCKTNLKNKFRFSKIFQVFQLKATFNLILKENAIAK